MWRYWGVECVYEFVIFGLNVGFLLIVSEVLVIVLSMFICDYVEI